jgi:hypothetical protein
MKPMRLFISVVAVATLFSGIASAEGPKNLLFYGNSFTLGVGSNEAISFGGVPEVVKQLAAAAGYPEPRVENAAVSGQSLAWHLANNTGPISNPGGFVEMPDFQWDTVILQEYSTKPTHIGDPPAFRADAASMFGLVRSHSLGADCTLFETWARGPGHSYYTGDPPTFPGGPAQMQQELHDNYGLALQDLLTAYGAGSTQVAWVGDAWEATGWDNLHGGDIYHASTRGTYLTGLVIFGTVYGERSTVGLPKLFDSLSTQEATDLQAFADLYLPPGLTFDYDGDDQINGTDLPGIDGCLTGPEQPYSSGDGCLIMDGTADDSVDMLDIALMQTAVFELPPELNLAVWDVSFLIPEASGTDSQLNQVTTSDATTPTVALAAVDLVTLATPAWLTVPASISAGTNFSVDVDVTGLAVGTYYARVTASSTGYEDASFTVVLTVTPASGDQTLYFDFGDPGQPTAGNYNNFTTTFTGSYSNLIDDTGTNTGLSVTVTDDFYPGSNQSGTLSPSGDALIFDAQATRDNVFGHIIDFGGSGPNPTAGFTLSGLSTAAGDSYTFTFFASRLSVGDNRETQFDVIGANSGTVYLDPANNQSNVAVLSGIEADVNGEITVNLSPGPNNNNSFGFYYLGAMKLEKSSGS